MLQDEGKLAELIRGRFPSVEMLRFTNSGTEATLMALAAAKAYTKKDKVVVFGGAYHGGAFSFAGGKSSAVNAPHEYVETVDTADQAFSFFMHGSDDQMPLISSPRPTSADTSLTISDT